MSYKGQVNIYDCECCGKPTVTIDRDEGVTPFMIDCKMVAPHLGPKGCRGIARSRFYNVPDPAPEPTWEWFKPTPEEARHYSKEMKDHFANGGLAMRRIQKVLIVDDSPELASALAEELEKEGKKVSLAAQEIKRQKEQEGLSVERLLEQLTDGNRQERREAHRALTKLERQVGKT